MTYSENGDTLDGHSPLQTFLVAYSSLALRMARIDHQTLLERFDDATIVSDLISDRYLQALSNVMTCGFLFWKHLIDVSSYDPKTTITAIVERFVQMPEAGVSVMSFMSKEILERSQRVPALVPKFFVQMTVVNRLMQHHHTLQQSMAEVCQEVSHGLHELPSQAYELFLLVDARFQHLISKQVPALTIDTCQGFVTELSTLLRLSVALDEQLLRKVMGEKMLPIQGLAMEDGAHLVELAWKFDTLRKCILHGRMEIRVQGVEFMQVELIHVYTKFIDNNPTQKTPHPIPQYLADFMLANKVVDYFVGVDSHPQLIQRCGNIIGFLLVTHRYTEAESDTIWRAVTNSQDSRFVEAILTILPTIFHVAQYPHLLYLTRKLNELSIFAFDGSMINYAKSLLDSLRRTFHNDLSSSRMDIPPFHLCIKLIRQAAVEASLEASRRRQINHFAAAELGCFLHYGLSDSDRRTIYQECIQDISDQNDSATGSIAAINALVSRDPEKELSSLTQVWDLAHLVAAEYAHKIKTARSADLSSLMLQEFLDCRMLLIQYLILFVPEKITPDVGSRLWEYGVGSEALNHQTREAVWMCFLAVIRKILHRNTFIDRCVREHLPRLQPSFYTLGALQFAYDVSNYHFRTTISRPQEDIKQETTAEDLLWHMSLTALPGTIERRANGMLVALYLDTPENTRRTRTAIEAIHIGVVERCIKQLTSAASKLKSFTDGTSSGEDEPMVIVAPEDEIQKQRLYLSRSLTILKEFFWGVRTRPKYSPQMQTQSQLPHETRTAKGDVIQIRYQPFGVGTTGEMRTVEVGDLETMQEFTLRLKFLTGFSKLTLISGGQKLDLGSIFTRTLQDLRLDQKGLLLVKKDPDSEAAPDLASISGLRPVEAEILTHFLDLYPLLGLEERLGKEVSYFYPRSPFINN